MKLELLQYWVHYFIWRTLSWLSLCLHSKNWYYTLFSWDHSHFIHRTHHFIVPIICTYKLVTNLERGGWIFRFCWVSQNFIWLIDQGSVWFFWYCIPGDLLFNLGSEMHWLTCCWLLILCNLGKVKFRCAIYWNWYHYFENPRKLAKAILNL